MNNKLDEALFAAAFLPGFVVNTIHANANNVVRTVANKIDEVKCEMHNRRHFDKKHNYIRRSKR